MVRNDWVGRKARPSGAGEREHASENPRMTALHAMGRLVRRALWSTVLHPRLLSWLIHVFDRLVYTQWQRAWGLYCISRVASAPPSARILGRVWIAYPERLVLEEHVRIGRGCFLFCMGGLSIGAGSILSRNVTIYTANHDTGGSWIPYDDAYRMRPVTIGRGVWIGMDVRIAPGVSIGDGAVIGMGTVVGKDVPANAVVVGAEQRVVGSRDAERALEMLKGERFFSKNWPDL